IFIIAVQTPASGIFILLAVGTPSTGSGNLYCQWELSPGSGNALCILFPTASASLSSSGPVVPPRHLPLLPMSRWSPPDPVPLYTYKYKYKRKVNVII
nr:hypothetical protein [Tanacetum cinerariifolium]GFC44114.1 hypothetical protein [Tanacetum cinerariifolium]